MDGWPASWRARMQRPRTGEWVTYSGERAPTLEDLERPLAASIAATAHLVPPSPAELRELDPIADLVADLVRRFDPGGYRLQCPVAGCGWGLHVPRMELDPLELLDGDEYVTHVEAVPREDVELVLRSHIHWHAAVTETDVRDAPLPPAPEWARWDLDQLHDEQDEARETEGA